MQTAIETLIELTPYKAQHIKRSGEIYAIDSQRRVHATFRMEPKSFSFELYRPNRKFGPFTRQSKSKALPAILTAFYPYGYPCIGPPLNVDQRHLDVALSVGLHPAPTAPLNNYHVQTCYPLEKRIPDLDHPIVTFVSSGEVTHVYLCETYKLLGVYVPLDTYRLRVDLYNALSSLYPPKKR